MTFSTKISSTALYVSRKVVFSRDQPQSKSTTLTGSKLKEIFGPTNKKKHQGMEKKVLDELAEAWESSNQTIHKRHRLLLGPSFAEVNFKKKHNDHINSSFCNDCLTSWYRSIFSNSFLIVFYLLPAAYSGFKG